jgi:hypothetical protein
MRCEVANRGNTCWNRRFVVVLVVLLISGILPVSDDGLMGRVASADHTFADGLPPDAIT